MEDRGEAGPALEPGPRNAGELDSIGPSPVDLSRNERLARLYLVLTRANRAIEQARGASTLLQSACETVVDVGRFRMSWAGLVDRASGAIVPVAHAGHEDGYLDFVQIRLDGVRSEGPTGQAVRLDRTSVCEDIGTDPRMIPWRDQALRHGYRSSVGLPLHREASVVGVLTVYADQPYRFDAGEIELLEELARDVSFGLVAIEGTIARHDAEAALAESEARWRATVETLLDPFVLLRAVRDGSGAIVDFVYEFANDAACAYNRLRREELVGRRLLEVFPEHSPAGLIELYSRVIETGEPLVVDDLEYVDSWGGERMARVFDVRASKLGESLAYTWRDVTERRQAVRRRAEELERRVQERTIRLEAARERATTLSDLSREMLEVASPAAVAEHLLQTARRVSGASDGIVGLVEPGSERITILGSFGYAAGSVQRIAGSDAAVRTPIRDAARSGEPIVVEDAGDFERRYPVLARALGRTPHRARVAFPLRAGEMPIGGVSLGFVDPRPIDEDEVAFFVSLANVAAHALERLRLAELEGEARGMLDTVVAQMPVGVLVAGRGGTVLYENDALARIRRGSADETDPGPPPAWDGERADGSRLEEADWPIARSLAGATVVNEEIQLLRPDGSSRIILQTSAPVRGARGDVIGAVAVTLDVTERREAEQLRDAFLGVLSHELRTPVTTIFGGAKVLASRSSHLEPDVRDSILDDIAAEADRLSRLIDDLLVLARAERGMDLTVRGPALVQHRLRAVTRIMAAEWPDRRFVCEIPDHVPPVTGDEAYLDQVLRNLLGNAAKYGRHEVIARVTAVPDIVEVTVLDDGPGVDPADQARIFELFSRARATMDRPGAGIGLFVARRLVEAMGGRLSVTNRPEGGAAFSVRLPQFADRSE